MNVRTQIAEIAKNLIKNISTQDLSLLEFRLGESFEIILFNDTKELVLELKESFVQTKDIKEYRYCLINLENNDFPSYIAVIQVSINNEISFLEGNPIEAIINHFSKI